jgi:hypothetical protein
MDKIEFAKQKIDKLILLKMELDYEKNKKPHESSKNVLIDELF